MTSEEKRSLAISKRLVSALIAIEHFLGDPEMIFTDAEVVLYGPAAFDLSMSQIGEVKIALHKLREVFCGATETLEVNGDV